MNGVIEWEKDGIPTGKFSPYIKIGKNPLRIILEDGKPMEFSTWKAAKQEAKNMEAYAKSEQKKLELKSAVGMTYAQFIGVR